MAELKLTDVDKTILRVLLSPGGADISTRRLAARLKLPFSTVQRRRKRLEGRFLKRSYTFDTTKFGWHPVRFLVSTQGGKTVEVAKKLLAEDSVTYIGRSIGQQTIDLNVDTILRNEADILNMLERLKGMDGIRDVIWTEIVEEIGKKQSVPTYVLNAL